MKLERDPRDRRYPERLAGSFLASLLIHAFLAALLFTVLVSSSQEGATENVQGGQVITIERLTPVVAANPPASVRAAPPVPHVTRIAPLQHAPLVAPQAQRLPTNRHELAVQAPTAPPNPRPIPQQTPQPNPQPTQNVFEVQPRNQVPAAPMTVPTPAPVAVATKPPPTTTPSPAPTVAPTVRPSPRPSVAAATPSPKPATPAPPVPKASPTAAPAARATASPNVTAAPAPRASAAPAEHPGVPSPSPTSTTAVASTAGTASSPGPKGQSSPGPRPGNGPKSKSAPARPVAIRPTPVPARVTPAPKPQPSGNLSAKLRSLLPNNPVNPSSKQYTPMLSLRGKLEPTPPPDVLARTKYMYDAKGTGNEERVKMWVTATRKAGPTTICTGWLVRYPQPERGGYADPPSNVPVGQPNGTQIAIGGAGAPHPPLSPYDSGIAPIVEGMTSQPCDGRLLVPFAPSAVPSP